MKFRTDRPIFQQIAAHIEDQIVRGDLLPEARVPAVREVALQLEVNPNTVVRSFVELEQANVIFKKRGLGYFVAPEARGLIIARRKREFLEQQLPEVVSTMLLLGIGVEAVAAVYERQTQALREGQTTFTSGRSAP